MSRGPVSWRPRRARARARSSSPDLEPLRGRTVVILPDNDSPGQNHADQVARALRGIADRVGVLRLPDLADKGDVSDWLAGGGTADDLRRLAVEALQAGSGLSNRGQGGQGQAVAAPGDGPTTPATRVLTTSTGPWVPFPSATLPEPFASFVHQTARARQCDPAAVALPLLSCLAGVVGNSRTVRIWPDWYAPAILWTALICRSGAVKSPGFYAAREPLDRLERKARTLFESEHADFELAEAKFQAAIQDWKRAKPGARGEPPIRETEEPTLQRFIVEDVTLQVLGRILSENPRGLLLGRDELSGWIRSFDQFSRGERRRRRPLARDPPRPFAFRGPVRSGAHLRSAGGHFGLRDNPG